MTFTKVKGPKTYCSLTFLIINISLLHSNTFGTIVRREHRSRIIQSITNLQLDLLVWICIVLKDQCSWRIWKDYLKFKILLPIYLISDFFPLIKLWSAGCFRYLGKIKNNNKKKCYTVETRKLMQPIHPLTKPCLKMYKLREHEKTIVLIP